MNTLMKVRSVLFNGNFEKSSSRRLSLFCFLFCFLIFASFSFSVLASADDPFSIVVLPDTQYYPHFNASFLAAQIDWVNANKSTLNIKYVIQVGDMVDEPWYLANYKDNDPTKPILLKQEKNYWYTGHTSVPTDQITYYPFYLNKNALNIDPNLDPTLENSNREFLIAQQEFTRLTVPFGITKGNHDDYRWIKSMDYLNQTIPNVPAGWLTEGFSSRVNLSNDQDPVGAFSYGQDYTHCSLGCLNFYDSINMNDKYNFLIYFLNVESNKVDAYNNLLHQDDCKPNAADYTQLNNVLNDSSNKDKYVIVVTHRLFSRMDDQHYNPSSPYSFSEKSVLDALFQNSIAPNSHAKVILALAGHSTGQFQYSPATQNNKSTFNAFQFDYQDLGSKQYDPNKTEDEIWSDIEYQGYGRFELITFYPTKNNSRGKPYYKIETYRINLDRNNPPPVHPGYELNLSFLKEDLYQQSPTIYERFFKTFGLDEYDVDLPSLVLESPANTVWQQNTNVDIRWSQNAFTGAVRIEQINQANQTKAIATVNGDTHYLLQVNPTDFPAGQYSIRIRDDILNDPSYPNNAYFEDSYQISVVAGPPIIKVVSPNGGELWPQATTPLITWTSSNLTGDVTIKLWKSGTFVQTIANVPGVSGSGSYSWAVPETLVVGNDYKISILQGGSEDFSDATFSILAKPTVTILSPIGGENWQVGSHHQIQWKTTNTQGSSIHLWYSTDSGNSFTSIGYTTDTGSYDWVVPYAPSIHCRIKASTPFWGISPNDFTISEVPKTITVTSPQAGNLWVAGHPWTITWTSTGKVQSFKIYINDPFISYSYPQWNHYLLQTVTANAQQQQGAPGIYNYSLYVPLFPSYAQYDARQTIQIVNEDETVSNETGYFIYSNTLAYAGPGNGTLHVGDTITLQWINLYSNLYTANTIDIKYYTPSTGWLYLMTVPNTGSCSLLITRAMISNMTIIGGQETGFDNHMNPKTFIVEEE